MSSLAQLINLVSKGEVTFGAGCKYSITELNLLESSTLGTVNRMNTPGFTGDELLLFKAYIILDVITSGSGQLIEKTVKDVRWKVQPGRSSSTWMDKALAMIDNAKNVNVSTTAFTQVERSDAVMRSLQMDNTGSPQYGNPGKTEW
jgi:hypothetical protein